MTPNRVEADPDRPYPVKEENGPWMIMACSFSGDGAEKQAKDLALELRKRYKLEAYTHKSASSSTIPTVAREPGQFAGPLAISQVQRPARPVQGQRDQGNCRPGRQFCRRSTTSTPSGRSKRSSRSIPTV